MKESFDGEGICGTENGILWEDSLDQFFVANEIDVVEANDEFITLKQGEKELSFRVFKGTEGSYNLSEHIDFN